MVEYIVDRARVMRQMPPPCMRRLDQLMEKLQKKYDSSSEGEILDILKEYRNKGYDTTKYDIDIGYIEREWQRRWNIPPIRINFQNF